jgi:hypothetical protein
MGALTGARGRWKALAASIVDVTANWAVASFRFSIGLIDR